MAFILYIQFDCATFFRVNYIGFYEQSQSAPRRSMARETTKNVGFFPLISHRQQNGYESYRRRGQPWLRLVWNVIGDAGAAAGTLKHHNNDAQWFQLWNSAINSTMADRYFIRFAWTPYAALFLWRARRSPRTNPSRAQNLITRWEQIPILFFYHFNDLLSFQSTFISDVVEWSGNHKNWTYGIQNECFGYRIVYSAW